MFQSIEYRCYLGYDDATKLYSYEYELIDSDFSCVVIAVGLAAGIVAGVEVAGAVIQEYSKRNLNSSTSCNVAANLIRYFRFYEKEYGYSIAEQIEWAEKRQPLFTPELKTELDKYLILL
jgi:hypothetical protein